MNGNLIADIVYSFILYLALACTALPVVYFILWKFLKFFRKNRSLFYLFEGLIFGGTIAGFYFTTIDWLLWYYRFPAVVQIAGLIIFALAFIMIRLAQNHLSFATWLFWPIIKQKQLELCTTGLYGFLRHPIYAFIPWLILGALLYTGEWMLLFPLFLNLLTRRWYAKKEEKYLLEIVGVKYEDYIARTPRRFYPKFWRGRRAAEPKKALA